MTHRRTVVIGHRAPLRPATTIASRRALASILSFLLVLAPSVMLAPGSLASAPPDFQTSLVVGDGLDGPSGFDIAPDGRIFILERGGLVKIVKNGALLSEPFVNLPSEATGDRGLIGIAFDPEFGVANHYVYFYYTGHDLLNHLVRYSAEGDVGTGGPYQLFQTDSPSQLLHVGGSIRFGPDGKLYFAVGDNGTSEKSQDLSSPHGKILRINKDGSTPSDNPFAGQPGKLGAVWAYGFRNPWRFQFDSTNGALYVGDVGDFTWEEINRVVPGGNYGWPLREGTCTGDCTDFIDPVYTYDHDGRSAAITMGPVYRGPQFPADYQGSLFFGDYAQGFIKRALVDASGNVTDVQDFDTKAGAVVDMKIATDGSMYYINYYPGALYHVTYNTQSHAPVATANADVTKGTEPLDVQFSSAGSSDPDGDPLSYLWTFGDGTTSTEANPTKTYTSKGVYTVRLTVASGTDQTPAQPIVIQVGIPPTLTVATPTADLQYRAGDTITYNAFASDAAGFDLDDGDIKTVVRLHHGTHYHPFAGPLTGRAGSFSIPTTGEAAADTSYEITVTATDGNGLSASKVVEIYPRRSTLTINSSPIGVGLTLDGVPISTPRTFQAVVGFQRMIAAPSSAVAADGTPMQFVGWSDGRNIRHTIATPDADTTYTANYQPAGSFNGSYYPNPNLSGPPVLVREDPKIDFDWGVGSPDPAVPENGFSARWTKTQFFGAGRYRFTTVTDDGVRLFIDNRLVIDHFHGQSGTSYSYDAALGTGNHTLRIEYFDNTGGATASLKWEAAPDQPDETYHAQYWNLMPSSGAPPIPTTTPDLERDELAVDYDWGPDSPDAAIAVNRFAARWTRTLNLAPGEYEFSVTGDDGIRLDVDGVRIIDQWHDQGPTTYTARLPLDGVPHTLQLDYYENGGGATARMSFRQMGDLSDPQGYQAQFWNTPDLGEVPVFPTRAPDVERIDGFIDADWLDGSPDPAITPNLFMAKWTRVDVFSPGVYRFSGYSDDGLRVYLDDVLVVNKWRYENSAYSVDKVVSAGPHTVRVEYFEAGGEAKAIFHYERIGTVRSEEPTFSGEYYANRELSGTPAVTRMDPRVDFDWGTGAPDPALPGNNFSARWTQTADLSDGTYTFTVTADDGVRLFVDGVNILDKWVFQAPTTYTASHSLSAGTHNIVLEYFEAGGGATARLAYERTGDSTLPKPPTTPFAAEYFDNPTLDGPPVITRDEAAVNFDWADGSPAAGVPVNGFSARWTRLQFYEAGTYRLGVTGDDGVRIRVDGVVVVDGWSDHPPQTFSADVPLEAGNHTVVVEFYERNGGALVLYNETRL